MIRNKQEPTSKGKKTSANEPRANIDYISLGLLDSSDCGILILDPEFKVAFINRAIERFFGLKREDVVGRDKRDLIRESIGKIFEDPTEFRKKVLATYDDNTYVERFECHVLPGEGREGRWLEHQSNPISSGPYSWWTYRTLP